MLTKLADLRGQRKAAFFIATNRLSALDAAVTRPGRWAADCAGLRLIAPDCT
jgi:ATP-dependent 26S proteasome regulatory subunit